MKKRVSVLLILLMIMAAGCGVCSASIMPSRGPGQIGLSSVVLCDSLSLYSAPGFDSAVLQKVSYRSQIIVLRRENGWAEVVLGDAEDSPHGWVKEDYIAVDPAWYQTEGETPVYAWNDSSAPRVALLDAGESLPILRDDGDWIVVSLRGAAGWIRNPVRTAPSGYPVNF